MTSRAALLLLPGMDGTDILFGPLCGALPEWIAPIPVTYPIDGSCDYDAAWQRVAVALDETLHAHDHCHVLGWSFSGPLALRAACHEPERVRSVSLVASFVTAPISWLTATGPLLTTPLVGVVRTLRRLPIWLGRAPDDPLRRDKARLWQTVPARTLAARARAIRRVDARDDLVACRAPLLYVASANDRVVPPHNLTQIRALRGDVEVATIPGDHFALYGEAVAGAAAIAAFVLRHEPRRDGGVAYDSEARRNAR